MIMRWRGIAGLSRSIVLLALLAAAMAATAQAARPTAAELLPENTLGFVSIPDVPDLCERYKNIDMWRMIQDPQVRPLAVELYSSMGELVGMAQNVIGLSLPEIVAIPRGEVTFAVVAVKEDTPALVLLLDAGDQIANARKMLDKVIKVIFEDNGISRREQTVSDVKITVFDNAFDDGKKPVVMFEKDGTIVLGTNSEVVKDMLAAWNGKKGRTLSDNNNFNAIMGRCKGDKDEEPQVIWFVDPINIMRSMAETAPPVRVGVAMLPVLGLDGLKAIGGSMIFGAGQYNSVSHIHVLLDNPRTGVIKMIALDPLAMTPERWAPQDVASYMTIHCDFETALKALKPMYDSLAGEGALSNRIQQRFSAPLGVDFEKQLLPALEGRVTYITWFERPITQVSGVTLVAIKFKDIGPAEKVLDSIASKGGERITKQSFAGKNYYRVEIPVPPMPNPPPMPIPCFGIVDDYVVITNRPSMYEKVLTTLSEDGKSLGEDLEYKLIANKIQRQSGGAKPVMIGYERPEEGMRYWYDLVNSDSTREALNKRAEKDPFFKALNAALEKQPLPPFEVIQKYLAPGGATVVNDDSGLHYMGFSLRRKGE